MVWVRDGESAVHTARELRPDLILMDLRLPGMNGWDAIQQIRTDALLQNIPIIAISVEAKGDDRRRAFDAGCNEYFSKPFSIVELRNAVQKYIG